LYQDSQYMTSMYSTLNTQSYHYKDVSDSSWLKYMALHQENKTRLTKLL